MDTAMENMRAPATILDTDGDVILVIGEAQDEIRVSSRALCAASQPLSALLTGLWREASEAQARSATNPFRLKLPEDNINHLRIACAVIHLRHHLVPEPVDISEEWLYQFALDAHKYHLGTALKFVSHHWFRFFLEKWHTRMTKDQAQFRSVTHTIEQIDSSLCNPLRDLAVAAYALEDAASFWEATLLLCLAIPLKSANEEEITSLFSDNPILPSRLYTAICSTVHQNHAVLNLKIATELRRLGSGEYVRGRQGGRKNQHGHYYHPNYQSAVVAYVSGIHDALFAQFFSEQLHATSLWPHWADSGKYNVAEHLKQLYEFKDLPSDLFTTATHHPSVGPAVPCRACSLSISQLARGIASEVLAGMTGVCLGCLHDGEEGNKCADCELRKSVNGVINSS